MKSPIPYRYRVQPYPVRTRIRWALGVILPNGSMRAFTTYPTRQAAIATAHILAGARGVVEVSR